MILILLYSYISLVYTTITYNTGKYTEYTEIVMSRYKEPLCSSACFYKDATLDEFFNIIGSMIEVYLTRIDIGCDVLLLKTLSDLKIQFNIPDSLDKSIIAHTDQFANNEKNQTPEQLAVSKLHGNIILLFTYYGYNVFSDLEIRVMLPEERRILVIDALNRYNCVVYNVKNNIIYKFMRSQIILYDKQFKLSNFTNDNSDMPVVMLFENNKRLFYIYLYKLSKLIMNIRISTVHQNISISDSSIIAPKNVNIRESIRKTYETSTFYLRNKTRPTCVNEHYYCNISNLDTLAEILSKVKLNIKTSLSLNLPVLIYFEPYYIPTILQVFRQMLKEYNLRKYRDLENYVKQYLFISLYGENDITFKISIILREIESIIYKYANTMEYTKNNEKKCLYLTVVLNDFELDIKQVSVDFVNNAESDRILHMKYKDLFISLINEFYENYKKTIFNVFNSIDHSVCKVVQLVGKSFYNDKKEISETYRDVVFCNEQINPIIMIDSKISKESILCNQIDWYNEIMAEITKMQLNDALFYNPISSQTQNEHKKNTKRSELQASKKEDTYTISTNDKNMQSIDKLLEFIEEQDPKLCTKKHENKKPKNTIGKTKAKDPFIKSEKKEVNMSKAVGIIQKESYLDDVIVKKTKNKFDGKVLANTNNLKINDRKCKDKNKQNLTFINDIKNTVDKVQFNDEKTNENTTTLLHNNTNEILLNSANEHLIFKKSENDAEDEICLAEASVHNKKTALTDIDNSNILKYSLKPDKKHKNIIETKFTSVSKESNELKHTSEQNADFSDVQNKIIDDGFTRVCTKKKIKEMNSITNNNQQTKTNELYFANNLGCNEKMLVNARKFQNARTIAVIDANIKKLTKDLNSTHQADHMLTEHLIKGLLAMSNMDNVQNKPSNKIQCNVKNIIESKTKSITNIYPRPKECIKPDIIPPKNIKVNTELKKPLKHSASFNDNNNFTLSSTKENQLDNIALNENSIKNNLKQDNKTSLDAQNILKRALNDIKNINTNKKKLTAISYKHITNGKEQNKIQVKKNNNNKSKKTKNIISINKKTIDKKHTKESDEEINLNDKIDNTNNEKLQDEIFEKTINRCRSLEIHESTNNSVNEHENILESINLDKIDHLIAHYKIYAYIYKGKHFNIKIHLNFLSSNEFVYLHLLNTEIIPLVPVLHEEKVSICHEKNSTNLNNKNSCVCTKCSKMHKFHNCSQICLNMEDQKLQELDFFIGLELSKKKLLCIIYEV